jgi:hypothetical protein
MLNFEQMIAVWLQSMPSGLIAFEYNTCVEWKPSVHMQHWHLMPSLAVKRCLGGALFC